MSDDDAALADGQPGVSTGTPSAHHSPMGPSPTSWDTVAPPRPYQAWWLGVGVLFVLPGLVATYLRVVPPTDNGPALLASFISYGVIAYLLALICFVVVLLRARRRVALGVASSAVAALLACHLAWLAPLFVADDRPPTTNAFTLMSLNLRKGDADPQQVVSQASTADVVVFLEATSQAVDELKRLDWDKRFPYSAGVQKYTAGDTVIYSRFPLSSAGLLDQSFEQRIVTAAVPSIGPVRIIAAHPCNPFCGSNKFTTEHQQLRRTVDANLDQPLIVAGDFNATDDHAPMRNLYSDGLESATNILGTGWMPTYPANSAIPPLIAIDHILLNHYLTATSLHRFKVANTDHLGLMATISGAV